MGKKPKMTKEELSWVLYDVGNSAFVLIMVTALMPIFFKDFAAAGMSGADSTANWGFANSTASFILAILSPVLGAMADYKNMKKRFFLFFLFFGLSFTLLLLFVNEGQWLICLIIFVFARVGWAGANVFYDAFLVDVTSRDRRDFVSTRGYGYGYVGSVIPFLVIIGLILATGMQDGLPVGAMRASFIIVACWWLLFSLPVMKNLHQIHYLPADPSHITASFKRLWHTVKEIRQHKHVFLFLAAYFFYIDGVGTIITMSTAYGRDLGFGVTMLVAVLLFIQLVAFPFALLFGKLAEMFSTRRMLMGGIGVYSLATLVAFFLPAINDPLQKHIVFWFIAFLVASSMGGIQALSRSYYSNLIPAEKSAQYFGFYNVFGKFAAISGPLLMGVVARLTGETRWGVLSILLLFIIGSILLVGVKDPDE
ncbi:MAG: MFS transporter [Desulforhopalus sp.]